MTPGRNTTGGVDTAGPVSEHMSVVTRICAPFEEQFGTWVQEDQAVAANRSQEIRIALSSRLFRQHKFAQRMVPWVDLADCGNRGYARRFLPAPGSCRLPPLVSLLQKWSRGAMRCNHTIVFAGDSLTRQLYSAVRNALILANSSNVAVAPWEVADTLSPAEAEETIFGLTGGHGALTDGTLRLRFFPVYKELVPTFRDPSWLVEADAAIMNIGAWTRDAPALEKATKSLFDGVDAAIRHVREVRPLAIAPQLIWHEYMPAHFPSSLHGPDNGPGEFTRPNYVSQVEWRRTSGGFHNSCSTESVPAADARDNWRLKIPSALLEQRRLRAKGSRWKVLPFFNAMWDLPDLHRDPGGSLDVVTDCRHWCQFSSATDFWVANLVNGLMAPERPHHGRCMAKGERNR